MKTISEMIDGYRRFRAGTYAQQAALYRSLGEGQSPAIMLIACADSRAEPSDIFAAAPGQLSRRAHRSAHARRPSRSGSSTAARTNGTSPAAASAIAATGMSTRSSIARPRQGPQSCGLTPISSRRASAWSTASISHRT